MQHAIERRFRRQVGPLISQSRDDLARRQSGVIGLRSGLQNGLALVLGQSVGRRRPHRHGTPVSAHSAALGPALIDADGDGQRFLIALQFAFQCSHLLTGIAIHSGRRPATLTGPIRRGLTGPSPGRDLLRIEPALLAVLGGFGLARSDSPVRTRLSAAVSITAVNLYRAVQPSGSAPSSGNRPPPRHACWRQW